MSVKSVCSVLLPLLLCASPLAASAACDEPAPQGAETAEAAAPEMTQTVANSEDCVTATAYVGRVRQPAVAAAPAPVPAAGSPAAGYQPKTAHDNTPYRFDMQQNGRRMTAEEFDAWMKARGIRVATGKPVEAAAPAAAPTAAPGVATQCQAGTTC
jgi:rare lipoprotein A